MRDEGLKRHTRGWGRLGSGKQTMRLRAMCRGLGGGLGVSWDGPYGSTGTVGGKAGRGEGTVGPPGSPWWLQG